MPTKKDHMRGLYWWTCLMFRVGAVPCACALAEITVWGAHRGVRLLRSLGCPFGGGSRCIYSRPVGLIWSSTPKKFLAKPCSQLQPGRNFASTARFQQRKPHAHLLASTLVLICPKGQSGTTPNPFSCRPNPRDTVPGASLRAYG